MNKRRWQLNKDYPTLEYWFKLHKWDSPIPKDILPERGIIIEDICAAGLYTDTSSKLGYVYGIFSNPNIPKIKLLHSSTGILGKKILLALAVWKTSLLMKE